MPSLTSEDEDHHFLPEDLPVLIVDAAGKHTVSQTDIIDHQAEISSPHQAFIHRVAFMVLS